MSAEDRIELVANFRDPLAALHVEQHDAARMTAAAAGG
jgi:hypothetical protein